LAKQANSVAYSQRVSIAIANAKMQRDFIRFLNIVDDYCKPKGALLLTYSPLFSKHTIQDSQ